MTSKAPPEDRSPTDGVHSERAPRAGARSEPVPLPPALARCVREAAEGWARRVLEQTQRDRRRVCGGWPGTLSDARALTDNVLVPQLSFEQSGALHRVGRDQVALSLYRDARRWWIQREVRNVEEPERRGKLP